MEFFYVEKRVLMSLREIVLPIILGVLIAPVCKLVTYRERVALTPDAVVEVKLVDVRDNYLI